jgi:hypoxia up-regulated 1
MYFDDRIVKYLQQKWGAVHPESADLSKELRPMAKLRKAAADAKKVLSANKDTPVFIQSLFNDHDFKTTISREVFVAMSEDLINRATAPLERLLEEKGLDKTGIDAIVIVGGGVRIPAVQQKIKDFMGMELAQNLNGDESFALGAAFHAANISTAFKPRLLGMSDITAYPVGVRLLDLPKEGEVAPEVEDDGELEEGEEAAEAAAVEGKVWSKKTQVFKKNNKLGKRRTVAFKHTKDFSATVYYTTAKILPAGIATPDVVSYDITGVEAALLEEEQLKVLEEVPQEPKVEVAFSLSSSGTLGMSRAELTLRKLIKVEIVKQKKAVNASETANTTEKDEEATDGETKEEDDVTEEKEATEEKDEVKSEGAADSKEESSDLPVVEEEVKEYKYHNKTVRIPLKIVTTYPAKLPLPMTKVPLSNRMLAPLLLLYSCT